jgi:CspA family cold shock protein
MYYGVIKQINKDKGYGFIRPDRGPDIFFLMSVVDDGGLGHITPRQVVSYELEKRDPDVPADKDKGPRAKRVLIIDRMPGGDLPPTPDTMQVKHHPKSRQKKPTWRR